MTRDRRPREVATLLQMIRPAVRREHVYAVASHAGLIAKLNQNESAVDLPPSLKEAIVEKLRHLSWNRYPTDYADPARTALAESLGVSADAVILSNGSNDLIYGITSAIVAAGTPVVLPDPIFSLYGKAVRLQDGVLTNVLCRPDLVPDVDGLIRAAKQQHSPLLMLTNPGSPTGTYLSTEEVVRIADSVPGYVLVDEAYHEFVPGRSAIHLLEGRPNLMVMRTFSKAVGLAGLRIGYVVGHPEVIQEIRKVRLPFVMNVLSEATMLAVLEDQSFVQDRVAEVTNERARLSEALRAMKEVDVRESFTNFLIFRTPLSSGEVVERMARQGVLIRDIGGYALLEDFVRVTVGIKAENQAFLVALKNVLDDE